VKDTRHPKAVPVNQELVMDGYAAIPKVHDLHCLPTQQPMQTKAHELCRDTSTSDPIGTEQNCKTRPTITLKTIDNYTFNYSDDSV
jgi:hypothetical protein